ncbi:MAG TPA: type II secretion system F family protein [Kiritimatiellia bacterium]|jgi:general secretion pathway protein F|nr:type II secretion system F family protein [Kiritimatiellia bacterium]HOM58798.1 type II secretion system F family protein [Kiritimatiellia bacterium]HOR97828.1 type II secretion system F family protein [Kiritimatiellia bacterium]HPC48789.1 type II secretion system F family protein [Kiritimatiellia bacterium]HPW75993.1 type II secretion system F family protein [Kiritimatiellia bacterium]
MASFSYKALTKDGRKVEGVLEAGDRRAALVAVERLGYTPISVMESKTRKAKAKGVPFWKLKLGSGEQRMKPVEVLLFTSELSDLLEAGMTLGAALNCLANQGEEDSPQSRIASDLRDRILRGEPFSDAVTAHPATFPPLYGNMIRAGEASGAMIEVLRRLVEHYERNENMRSKITSALTYPTVVLIFGVLTVIFAMVKVIPQFAKIFEGMGTALPTPTLILVGMSDFVVKYGVFLVAAIGIGGVMFKRYLKTDTGRLWWDGLKLKAPLIRGIVACGAYSSLAYTMKTLLANGVNVLQALRIAEETCGNALIAEALRNARQRVTDGTTISGPLAASKVFPRMMTDMLAVGEQSGDMPSSLGHIGRRYENEMDRNIKIFTNALEPILIVLIGGVVGFVAVSILMAVFKVTSSLSPAG